MNLSCTSYKIAHKMTQRGKPFSDGNFIKECMTEVGNDLRPEKVDLLASISLSGSSTVRRTEELGENIGLKVRENVKNVLYSLVLYKSTDLRLPDALSMRSVGKTDIFCALKPVVSALNFIRGHALNHRQFQAFLEEIDFEFCDLPYHTAVRWLNCDNVFSRFL
ncbi:Hypothetical predicted protein [Octopus vulgaris]|uniref:Uncharacterized protein n=1 Tax=Octopus vulgaris TaxID=6645 RepID=A0AA36B9G2_OCTVU|nr:Hypothetical predicted protein [Octopus vulgaris]